MFLNFAILLRIDASEGNIIKFLYHNFMKKTLQQFLGCGALSLLALATCGNVTAQSVSDVEASFLWKVGNEDNAEYSEDIAAYVSSSSLLYGSDLTTSVVTGSTYDNKFGTSGVYSDMAAWQPGTSTKDTISTDDMVEFSVKMKKGVTFTPTSVSYDAIKNGTDNATYSWSYTLDGVESEVVDMPDANVLRDKAGSTASLNHVETISAGGVRTFTFRIYLSKCANNKKISIANVKLNGKLNGEVEKRKFVNFAVDFRTDPYTGELPSGVSIAGGAFHDAQHGYQGTPVVTVPVDGPVKFTIGSCQFGGSAVVKNAAGDVLTTIDTKTPGCDSQTSTDHFATWTYNVEAAEKLTFELGGYCPFFKAEACDLLPDFKVSYYNTDGSLLGQTMIQGGSALTYKFSESDVKVPSGCAFRGWFNSDKSTGSKVKEGTIVQANLNLYAKATSIETVSTTARFIYNIAASNFYMEDHECISTEGGAWHDTQHGWVFSKDNSISVPVAGKAIISVANCQFSAEGAEAVVTDANGKEIAKFNTKVENCGAEASFRYDGEATTLKITFTGTSYIARVSVFNVVDFVQYDEATGYYVIPAGDVNSFLMALTDANGKGNVRIFLPDGTYDLGETALTPISGDNISIIGQSMDKTIVRNAPLIENEGIGSTATFLITGKNTYFQDLTIQNALDYYKAGSAGRAVCIQDKGDRTICKNVKMLSYQDTYYSNPQSKAGTEKYYWEDCEIHGVVDYICGGGDVYFNRCLLVNESRKQGEKNGEVVIAAPYTDEGSQFGYVFNNCTVENLASSFSFARAWGGKPRCAYINTKLNQPDELTTSGKVMRFTVEGMNVPADKFVEYNSVDANGNVVSPASNVVPFVKGDVKNEMETILTAEQAAAYAISNVFADWDVEAITAQKKITVAQADGKLTWTGDADAYAVFKDGVFEAFTTATEYDAPDAEAKYSVRAANIRGGLCQDTFAGETTDLDEVEASEVVSTAFFSLSGARLAQPQHGLNIMVRTYANGTKKASRVVVK